MSSAIEDIATEISKTSDAELKSELDVVLTAFFKNLYVPLFRTNRMLSQAGAARWIAMVESRKDGGFRSDAKVTFEGNCATSSISIHTLRS